MAKGWTELAKGIGLSPAGRVMERASPPATQKRSSTPRPRTQKSAAGTAAGATAASAGDAAPASKETVDELRLTKKVAKAVGASAAVAAAAVSASWAPRARAQPRRACCTAASRRWWLWSVWPMFCAAWLFGLPVKDAFSSLSRAACSVADVTEAAGELVEVGANATVHVARETVRVLATTADLADEL